MDTFITTGNQEVINVDYNGSAVSSIVPMNKTAFDFNSGSTQVD